MTTRFIGDKLIPGKSLKVNEGIQSKNRRVKVVLQSDGNFVLYGDKRPLWWTGVRPGVNTAIMQTDGNLVVYINAGKPGVQAVWATDTSGHPGAYLAAQDDGNLVLYQGSRALWSSETNGFRYYGGPGKGSVGAFLEDAASVAGSIMPYAQAILSVTGVGSIVSGALSMTSALVSGKKITDVFMDGLQGAIPGGPAVKAAFNVTRAAIDGKPIDQIALSALPIPEDTKKILNKGLSITKAVASGQNISAIAISEVYQALPSVAKSVADQAKKAGIDPAIAVANASMSILPKDMQQAVALTVAVGHAANVQKAVPVESFETRILRLRDVGTKLAQKNSMLGASRSLVKDPTGFDIGTGLMIFGKPNQKTVTDVRSRLKPGDERKGFDLALATQIGMVKHPAKKGDPVVKAGYYATMGLQNASNVQQTALIKTMAKNPRMRKGVKVAAKKLERLSLWRRIKRYIGLEKAA